MQAKYYYLQSQAHLMVKLALRHGDLIQSDHCQKCGKTHVDLDAHHMDYSRPLDVVWLCRSCHLYEHPRPNQWTLNNGRSSKAPIVSAYLEGNPQAIEWPVRQLAETCGVGKSTAANVIREYKKKHDIA